MNQERSGLLRRFLQSPFAHLMPYTAANRQEEMQAQAFLRHLLKEARREEAWDAPLAETRFVVIDTETTGFQPKTDAIISVGAVEMSGDRVNMEQTFHSYLYPDPFQPVPKAIVELTGIRDEDLASAPRLEEVLHDLLHFLKDSVLVMHHADHDVQFLNAGLQRTSGLQLTHRVLDTCDVANWLYACPASVSLDDLLLQHGIPVEGRHTALGDAKMTASLWQKMLNEIQQRNICTVGELFESVVLAKRLSKQ